MLVLLFVDSDVDELLLRICEREFLVSMLKNLAQKVLYTCADAIDDEFIKFFADADEFSNVLLPNLSNILLAVVLFKIKS